MGQFIKREDYILKTHMYEVTDCTEIGQIIFDEESTKAMVIKKEYHESYFTLNDGSKLYEIELFEAIVLKWRNMVLVLNQDYISKDDTPIICKFVVDTNADAAKVTYNKFILDFCTKSTSLILNLLEPDSSSSFEKIEEYIGERHTAVLKDCIEKIRYAIEEIERN